MESPAGAAHAHAEADHSADHAAGPILSLPFHIFEDILLRLDACSLARCCAVCPAWRTACRSQLMWTIALRTEFGLPAPPPGVCPTAPVIFARARVVGTWIGATAAGRIDAEPEDGTEEGRAGGCGASGGGAAGETPQEVFRRLARSPLAAHLAAAHRLAAVAGGVRQWALRVRLLRAAQADAQQHAQRWQAVSTGAAAGTGSAHCTGAAAAGAAAVLGPAGGVAGAGTHAAAAPAAPAVVVRQEVVRCRGTAANPQSLWLRFGLPGWVRREAERRQLPAWCPELMDRTEASRATAGTGHELELTVFALGADGRPWPALHSRPFFLPQDDRQRLLQSHVEGLYVWCDEEEDGESEDEDGDGGEGGGQGSGAAANGAPAAAAAGTAAGSGGAGAAGSGAGGAGGRAGSHCDDGRGASEGCCEQRGKTQHDHDHNSDCTDELLLGVLDMCEEGDGGPRPRGRSEGRQGGQAPLRRRCASHGSPRPRPPLQLAAYLHYEQLLPVCPRGLMQQFGLPLALPPPPPSHPGSHNYQPPPANGRSLLATANGSPDDNARGRAGDRGSGPVAYLFIDWCRLPGAITTTTASTVATGGWVGGCVVRLWENRRHMSLIGGGAAADGPAPPSAPPPPATRAVEVVGDTRHGDIAFLPAPMTHASPPPAPPQPPPPPLQHGQQQHQQQQQAVGSLNPTMGTCSGGAGNATTSDGQHSGCGPSASAVDPAVAGSACDVLRRLPDPTPLARAWVEAVGWDPSHFEARDGVYGSGGEGSGAAMAGGGRAAAAAAAAGGAHGRLQSGSEVAARLQALCEAEGDALMVDFALLDARGGVRLGRCGVEMWNDGPQAAAHGPAASSCARMHFLLDQLPPRHQSLWDSKLAVAWGMGAGGGGAAAGAGAGAGAAGAGAGAEVEEGGAGEGSGGVGAAGGRWGGPWARVSLEMPLRNWEVLMG